MKTILFNSQKLLTGLFLFHCATGVTFAAADLWIRDDASDTGNEPNTSSTLFYVSDDIWIRRSADPNYDPRPFPSLSPTWVPLPHEGPCYRDPKTSSPNYIYVRVRNRGDAPSSGTESLHVYWAKASTGLSWPGDWKDHLASPCGGAPRLYGYEVTKPRKNGASATPQEQADYVSAIQSINTASFLFPDGSTYFAKQNAVHSALFFAGIHSSLRFLPWHRELMNRYEALLREVHPTLTLLYWDWTTNPSGTINYMGTYNGIPDPPFTGFGTSRSKFAGTPGAFTTGLSAGYQSATLLPSPSYASFWGNIEVPSHNQAHNYLGGVVASQNAARDPMFFMLHANCDRLWALWQRQNVNRWTPSLAYDASQADAAITSDMRPWNGADGFSPWQNQIPGDPNGYVISKAPTSHSITYPPTYDDAPLRVPVLNPGECAIIEIPFYPPPATECGGFSDPQHLCLLARIEPVTVAEGASVWDNARNNNNVAWKNVTVSDCNVGPFFALAPGRVGAFGELIRNTRDKRALLSLRFDEALAGFNSLFNFGHVRVRLEQNLMDAWVRGGSQGKSIERVAGLNEILVFQSGATLDGLPLAAGETGRMDLALELNRGYAHPAGNVYHLDVLQFDDQGNERAVGGQRYDLDFNSLPIVRKGSDWRYLDGGAVADPDWAQPNYDAQKWKIGTAVFGYGRPDAVTGLIGTPKGDAPTTCYFRQEFRLPDPKFFQNLALNLLEDDGVVVYLNGREIFRHNLPAGDIVTPETFAVSPIFGAAARAYHSVDISQALELLVPGRNVLAAELHSARSSPANGLLADLSFDLAVDGNVPPYPYQPPTVVIDTPWNGGIVKAGQPILVRADVVDPDGDLASVRILVDGQLTTVRQQPPFGTVIENVRPGAHRVSVLAEDQFGNSARMESVFTALDNLPPTVTVTAPLGQTFAFKAPVTVSADASDSDGKVVQVLFYVKDHASFGSPRILVGESKEPPYTVEVTGLAPGMYMATAEAKDDKGAIGYSLTGHFFVSKPEGTAPLGIRSDLFGRDRVLTLDWLVHGATLEHTDDLNRPSWQPITDALSPFLYNATGDSDFFRLRLPDAAGACACDANGGGCNCGANCQCHP